MFFIALGLALAATANADALDYPILGSGIGVLQASSEWGPSFSLSRALLNFDTKREGGQSWSAAYNDLEQWIQISSQKIVRWKSLLTQGRGDADEWVKSFLVQYNVNGTDWVNYDNRKVFYANTDRSTVVTHDFDVPFLARAIRILPLTWYGHISMRLEAYVNDDIGNYTHQPVGTILVPAIDSGLPVSSSSEFDPSHSVSRIRLNFNITQEGASGWEPAVYDLNQWVQVSSPDLRKWAKISTQGAADTDSWVTSYYISYSPNGVAWYQADGERVFTGNSNRDTVVSYMFNQPFEAKAIRIHPIGWYSTPSMRLEVYYEETLTVT